MWADALNEWGYLPAPGPSSTSSDNTRTLKTGAKTGSSELPSTESCSSSDSWASALSDWIQSVSVPSEESLPQFFMPIQDMTKEKALGLVGFSESGDSDPQSRTQTENFTRPLIDKSVLNREETENRSYIHSDFIRTQDLPEAMKRDIQWSGLEEKACESQNDGTEKRLEGGCVCVSKVSSFHSVE